MTAPLNLYSDSRPGNSESSKDEVPLGVLHSFCTYSTPLLTI